ncbi:unnamed protein product [Hydatigera taeniaeformis]|uniref:RRM domain-containing protein n=1 Tax=Hydatigena taeniaeformis TaxID=6205 RepID=A0A0R3X2D3_HYDTA|nr:unnamed protein product [Hydatigera taeniaeformis]
MGINSTCANNETSLPPDVRMASSVVDANPKLASCLSSNTNCASPSNHISLSNNGSIGMEFVGGPLDDLKNGTANVTVVEAEGQEADETEVEEGEGDEETVFPHEPGKIFIGGLNPSTTIETLKFYFRKYGEIKNSLIMRDIVTKKSR